MARHKFAIIKNNVVANVKHYSGFPTEVAKNSLKPVLLKPSKLLLLYDTGANGYELNRYDEDGNFAGDTWHPTEENATDQVLNEFNLKGICWRDIPIEIDDPFDYAIQFMRKKIELNKI